MSDLTDTTSGHRGTETKRSTGPDCGPDVTARRMELERRAVLDIVEEWGLGSFPASDPPANW